MGTFTPESLVEAITRLFQMNRYQVEGPLKLHGAEVDLVATPIGDPFGKQLFIEATVEHVDNDKYGKDVGKLALIGEKFPDAQRLIVSSSGFSLPVRERAEATRILTLTYDELFKKFEKFEPYLAAFSPTTERGAEYSRLCAVYEEPNFEDALGNHVATRFLSDWKNSPKPDQRWLVVTGEYGTGKTALTKVLHKRWMDEYKANPSLPIPFRIELRGFTRQFDARGLLHRFLDQNALGHISIDFVQSLIRGGRAVLLLDGYDEMAQYFNARERRACLEALAELSADGAKGLLTSRPNYFTEAEELHVFEVLYSSLKAQYYLSSAGKEFLEKEHEVDRLLEKFLNRFERTLRDLTQDQTEALISRILSGDQRGKEIVLSILSKVVRGEEGASRSLSGKPVIVSYLLEVVDQLKRGGYSESGLAELSEWGVYTLILDQLMTRDLLRSPEMSPAQRRHFLRKLAVFLSKRDNDVISEEEFKELIAAECRRDLARHTGDARVEALARYFADLRSSTTLTKASGLEGGREGWRFSHNSLREFLLTEHLVSELQAGDLCEDMVPISDAMKTFAAAIPSSEQQKLLVSMRGAAKKGASGNARGQVLSLCWDGFRGLFRGDNHVTQKVLQEVCGSQPVLSSLRLTRVSLSTVDEPLKLAKSRWDSATLRMVSLSCAVLNDSDFSDSVLEEVSFKGAELNNVSFRNAMIVDSDFTDATLVGASFLGVKPADTTIFVDGDVPGSRRRHEGNFAVGFFRYWGAQTEAVSDYYVYWHHPNFAIVSKVMGKLAEGPIRQRRGLEQRGAAHFDVPFAREFVQYLIGVGVLEDSKGRKEIVQVTSRGRDVIQEFLQANVLAAELQDFCKEKLSRETS